MTQEGFKRKLTSIFNADAVGYSRLMGDDEAGTVRILTSYRNVIFSLIKQHNGTVIDSPGDNLLAEFVSVVDAVQCAVAVQKEIKSRNEELPENRRMQFRIGINLGDVIQEDDRIYGDGVNVAARLEGLAEPGGICISKTAFEHIESKLPYGYEFLGDQTVKNIARPVGAYRVQMEPRVTVKGEAEKKKTAPMRRKVVFVGTFAVLILVAAVGFWQFYMHRPSVEPASVEKMAYPLPDKPSIAVLPFTNLSGDPAQDYLADGITESITTTLSKIPNFFVIFRHSTFTYKGKPVSVKQVAEELGVRYVLEGSVQRSGDKLRITAQLIDALTGHHLWAEEYDREFSDLFQLQDDISQHVMTELEVKLTYGEEVRVRHRQTNNPQAYQYFMQGLELHRRFSKLEMAQSAELYKKAVALDPKFATAWVFMGYNYATRGRRGWIEEGRDEGYAHAMELAQKALAIDASNVDAFALQAYILGYWGEYEKAITLLEKAVALNPNHANNIALLARSLIVGGQPEEGLALMKKAMRLSPYYPAWYQAMLGRAHYILEEYDEAIAAFGRYHDRHPEGPDGLLQIAYAYAAAGQIDEAKAKVAELFKQYPAYTVKNYGLKKFRDPIVRERILNDLRKAGLN